MNKAPTTGILAPVIPLLQQRESTERGSLTLRETIDAYMAGYEGRDPTRNARVGFWAASLGDVRLRNLDSDMIGDALDRLATMPVQRYTGRDAEGRPKLRNFGPRSPATLNRYAAALGAVLTWAKRKRLTSKGWQPPLAGIEANPEAKGRERSSSFSMTALSPSRSYKSRSHLSVCALLIQKFGSRATSSASLERLPD